jgi:hypothetical protein
VPGVHKETITDRRARGGVDDMSPKIIIVLFLAAAAVFFSLGFVYGVFIERGEWEHRITRFAAYLEKTTVPLKIEKDVFHTVATALRLFSRKRL